MLHAKYGTWVVSKWPLNRLKNIFWYVFLLCYDTVYTHFVFYMSTRTESHLKQFAIIAISAEIFRFPFCIWFYGQKITFHFFFLLSFGFLNRFFFLGLFLFYYNCLHLNFMRVVQKRVECLNIFINYYEMSFTPQIQVIGSQICFKK